MSTPAWSGVTPGGSITNNGSWGCRFTVGAANISAVSLGRWKLSGNSGSHRVYLVDVATGLDVPGGSVTVDLSTGSVGDYVYVSLASPVALVAGTQYYLVSEEAYNQDYYYDVANPPVTLAADIASIISASYSGSWTTTYSGLTYGPVNLLYTTGGGGGKSPYYYLQNIANGGF